MFIIGSILITMAKATHLILGLYQIMIIAAIVMTWVKPQPTHETTIRVLKLLHQLTDPVFNWTRQLFVKKFGKTPVFADFDLTPALIWFALFLFDSLFYMILMHLGLRMTMGFMEPDII